MADLPVLLVDVLLRLTKLPQEEVLSSRDWEVLQLIYSMSRSVDKHGDNNVARLVLTKQEALFEMSRFMTQSTYTEIRHFVLTTLERLRDDRRRLEDGAAEEEQTARDKSRFGSSRKVGSGGALDFQDQVKLDVLNEFVQFFWVSRLPHLRFAKRG